MDSITHLPCNLIYRSVQIPQKKKWINNLWQLPHLPLQGSFCQNLNPRVTSPGFLQGFTAALFRLLRLLFLSLPVCGLAPCIPEPYRTRRHAHTHTHMRSHILFLEPHAVKVSLLRAFKFLSSFVLPLFCVEYLKVQESHGQKKSKRIPALIWRLMIGVLGP